MGHPKHHEGAYSQTHLSAPYYLLYDVYIRCSNRQKLQRTHIPALNDLLNLPSARWTVEVPFYVQGQFKLLFREDMPSADKGDLLLYVTRKMCRVSRSFSQNIDGIDNESQPLLVEAFYRPQKPRSVAPAITSALFSIYQDSADAHGQLDRRFDDS